MDIRFDKKIEVKEFEVIHKIYIAFDGTEFDNRDDCMAYEETAKEKILSGIIQNKAAESFAGFDGNEHSASNNYRWFYPQSIEDIDTLNKCFDELNLIGEDINQWICIEYDLDYEVKSLSYLDECIKYAKNVLNKFGYEMQVTKESEGKRNSSEITLQAAKDLINDFTQNEYESDANFSDLSKIPVAYTTTEDGKYEVQAYCDLVNYEIYTTVGGDIVSSEHYGSLDKMIDALEALDFIALTAYPDPEDYEFEVIEVASKAALFSNGRIPKYVLPEGWSRYDLRGGDDNDFCTIEKNVVVNHSGSIILPGSLDFGEKGYIEIDEDSSPNFMGYELTIPEFEDYLTKYKHERSEA